MSDKRQIHKMNTSLHVLVVVVFGDLYSKLIISDFYGQVSGCSIVYFHFSY